MNDCQGDNSKLICSPKASLRVMGMFLFLGKSCTFCIILLHLSLPTSVECELAVIWKSALVYIIVSLSESMA